MRYLLLSFLCVLLLLSACEIKEFSLPVWDIELSIPLINDRYYVSELIDSVHIVTDADSLLQIVATGEITTDEIFSVSLDPDVNIVNTPIPAGMFMDLKLPLLDSEDSVRLCYGQIMQGLLRYRFSSVSPAVAMITLRFEDIRNAAGNVLQMNLSTQEWIDLDLTGYTIGTFNSMEILDSLSVTVSSQSDLPEGMPIANISMQIQDVLHFSVFQGSIEHMVLTALDPAASLDVDYPLNIDQAVTLSTANIVINLYNELGFSTEFSGWFEARSDTQLERVPIHDENGQNYRIPAASGNTPGEISLVLTNDISPLMQIMPHHIELVQANFLIDSTSGIGTLRNEDEITADYTIEAPFRFTVHELPIEVDSVLVLEISEENRERIGQNLLDARLQLQVKNTIPIGGYAYAYFGSSPDIDVTNSDTYAFVKSLVIHSGQTHTEWQDIAALELSRDELLLFADADVYLKWVFGFEESVGEVSIYASTSDYIALRGNISAKVRMEEDK